MVAKKRPLQEEGSDEEDKPTLQKKPAVKVDDDNGEVKAHAKAVHSTPSSFRVVALGAFSTCEDLDALKKAFSRCGKVTHAQFLRRGMLMLTYETEKAARETLELDGKITWANDKPVKLRKDEGPKETSEKGKSKDNGKKEKEKKKKKKDIVKKKPFADSDFVVRVSSLPNQRQFPTDKLRKFFEARCGKIDEVRVRTFPNGKCTGTALVKLPTEAALQKALALNSEPFEGRKVEISKRGQSFTEAPGSKRRREAPRKAKKRAKTLGKEEKVLKISDDAAHNRVAPSSLPPAKKESKAMGKEEKVMEVDATAAPAKKKAKTIANEKVAEKEDSVKADADDIPGKKKMNGKKKKAT